MDLQTTIAKYGLIVVLCIVLLVIGIALYLWKKDEGSEDSKKIATAGLAMAVVGGVLGLGSIAYNTFSQKNSQPNNGNSSSGTGEDSVEGE